MGKAVEVNNRARDVCCCKMPYRARYNKTTFEYEEDTIF